MLDNRSQKINRGEKQMGEKILNKIKKRGEINLKEFTSPVRKVLPLLMGHRTQNYILFRRENMK